jgi:hypothetical protein
MSSLVADEREIPKRAWYSIHYGFIKSIQKREDHQRIILYPTYYFVSPISMTKRRMTAFLTGKNCINEVAKPGILTNPNANLKRRKFKSD